MRAYFANVSLRGKSQKRMLQADMKEMSLSINVEDIDEGNGERNYKKKRTPSDKVF